MLRSFSDFSATERTDCKAHMAGVSVLHEQECGRQDCAAAGGNVVEAASADAEATCPRGQRFHDIVQTWSGRESGAEVVSCIPR